MSIKSHYNGFEVLSQPFFLSISCCLGCCSKSPTKTDLQEQPDALGTCFVPSISIYTTALHKKRICTNYSNLRKVRWFLRSRFLQNRHYSFSDSDMSWFSDCSLSSNVFQNMLKRIRVEGHHSWEDLNAHHPVVSVILLSDVLSAKTSRLPGSQ